MVSSAYHLTCLLRNLYPGKEATVRTKHGTCWFQMGTGSKLGKKYVKVVYCHPDCLTYKHSTSCKMLGWMKPKLKSRLPGEISVASGMQMICHDIPFLLFVWSSISFINVLYFSKERSFNPFLGFPGSSAGKESNCNAEDPSSIPWLGRSPGERHCNPIQYSSLENHPGQRNLVGYSPWGCKDSAINERPSTQYNSYLHLFLGILSF